MKTTIIVALVLFALPAFATPAEVPKPDKMSSAQVELRAHMAKKLILKRQAEARKTAFADRALLSYQSLTEQESAERTMKYAAAVSVSLAVLALVLFFSVKSRSVSMNDRRAKIEAAVKEAVDYVGQMKHLISMTHKEAEVMAVNHLELLRKSPEFRVRGHVDPPWGARIKAEVARRKARV